MKRSVLFLLATLACPRLLHCRPFFFLAAPNVLRAETEETIVIQAHEYTTNIDIEVSVYNFPIRKEICNASTTLKAPHYIENVIIKIPFANVKPTFSKEKQYVTVEAKSKSVPDLVLQKNILLSLHTGYIYIQTDKSIYTPTQTVHYRLFVTNQRLDPTTRYIDVELQNPSGVTVKHESWNVQSGLLSLSLPIPELASSGNWKIIASFIENPEQKYVAEFEVKEYVLPSFEVTLTSTAKYFHVNDTEITININARYFHNEAVYGHALAVFGIMHESKKTHLHNSFKRVDIDSGEGSVTLTNKHLEEVFEQTVDILGASIFVNVTVVSSGGDVVHAEKSGIKIVDSPFRIRFIRTPSYFKPGIPFHIMVVVTNPDESPAAGVEVIADPGQVKGRTDNDGVASLGLNTRSDSKEMSIKVTTNDGRPHVSQQATNSLHVTAYKTVFNSGNFLHIQVANAQQELLLHMHTKHADAGIRRDIRYFTILLFAKGTIIKFLRQELISGGEITALRIEKTPEMWPNFRIVAYYYLTQGKLTEIVSDSVWVDMPGDHCMGTLELKQKESIVSQYSPGSKFSLQLIADKGAKVGLVAVDKALYALNKKSKLSQKKIRETVEKRDFGCTHGGGKNNLKVFEDAGLDFVTNVGIATAARTELNCPLPPSRKRRAIKNVQKKRTKENEYSGEARDCCRAGFRENPMGFSCDQRKAYIHLGESCKRAFVDCCKFAEALQPEQREELIYSRADDDDEDDDEDPEDGISVMIRSDFPESWYWKICDVNDQPGKPTLKSVLIEPLEGYVPHSITTWAMVAISIKKDRGICVSKPLELMVTKKLFVDLKLPYSVVRNEQVEIKAVLYNHLDESLKVTVKFQYDESLCSVATRRKGYSVKVSVPKHSSVAVPYVVIPLVLGKIMVKVEVRLQYASDAIQKPLNVVAEGQLIRLSRSILLNPEGKLQLEEIKRGRFDDLVPNTEPENFISIQGDILGESLLGSVSSLALQSMIDLPTGCPEQHLFRTTPNVIITKYLDDTRQWDLIGVERRKEVIGHIVDGYNKQMMTFRWADSSFQGGTWLTAYILKIFAFANEPLTIDHKSLCMSVDWLLTQKQNSDGAFNERGKVYVAPMKGGFPGSEAEQSLTAFVLIALNQTKEICKDIVQGLDTGIQKATKYLERHLPSLKTTYSAVITSYALALVGSPQANDVIDNFGENKIYWPYEKDPKSMYTVETTAYALLHKIQQKKYDETHRIAEWLVEQRNIGGGYRSTQPTAVALQALAQYKRFAQHRNDMQLNVTLEIFGRAEPKVWIINSVQRFQPRSEKVLANKEIKIKATGSGKGTLTVMTVYQSLPKRQNKECKAFMLTANLESVEKGVKKDFLATYKLTIRARYLGVRDSTMSIIDIKMLTSFIPEENDLKQLTNTVENYISQYEPQTTANNGSVIIYLDEVSRTNDTILSFKVYQSLEATFLQPAAVTIYEYYDPDKRCDTYYSVPDQADHLRKLCQGSACKCAEGKCASLKDLGNGITTKELNDAACEVGVDYVYRVTLTKTEQFDSDMYDRHNMKIEDVIKSGTEQMNPGSSRTFFSHLTCREKLKLEENKQYLVMGLRTDMWEMEKHWTYLLGGKSYVLLWPERDEEKNEAVDILEEFAMSFKNDGCQT